MRVGLERGGRFAAIELTSEALAQRVRLRAWPRYRHLTNLSHDPTPTALPEHHSREQRQQLFINLQPGGFAVLNACDPASELLAEVIRPGIRIVRYGVPSRGNGSQPPDLGRPRWRAVLCNSSRSRREARGELAGAPPERIADPDPRRNRSSDRGAPPDGPASGDRLRDPRCA